MRQSIWSTEFESWQGMSCNRNMFMKQIFVGFPLTFPTTNKTHCSDVGSSRYYKKTPKNDLRQFVISTEFKNWQGMRCNHGTFMKQRFVGFSLTFPRTPKYIFPTSIARDIAEKHQDQRSRSTLGYVLTKINGQDLLLDALWPWSMVKIDFWMCFDQDQRSKSTFGCVLTMINSQDRLLDAFWPRSMVKIDFRMCFDQDQQSRLTLGCVLTTINNQDWL